MNPCKSCGNEYTLPIPYEQANALRDYCMPCILRLQNDGILKETVLGEPIIVRPLEEPRATGEVYLEDFL